jgi:hypothetical protein
MPMVIAPESAWGKELAKWNTPRNEAIKDANGDEILDDITRQRIMGMGCIGIERYPKMLYKAQKNMHGKVLCMDINPPGYLFPDERAYDRACQEVDAFNRRCYRVVRNDEEYEKAKHDGWCDDPTSALHAHELCEQAIANAAAEANFSVRGMSRKAREEFAAAGAETSQHVTDVAGVPKARRGRPRKAQPVVADEAQHAIDTE